ncbi:hypothetical protein PpBr36_03461 [Pyricularia pennisetigena]|uniref:hypothetical protein n=1 Tax=Pyricularia pennisetigena TaxID=1578925 RepID=UPI001152249B|nr:hypothetical protein PpBr36_03461 [Pyricularia pennisetigena]TLS30597.1 hypothetical protein PpBr36_03461 [Pyricularia pennisetigena]
MSPNRNRGGRAGRNANRNTGNPRRQDSSSQQPYLNATARAQERQQRADAQNARNQYNQQNYPIPQQALGSLPFRPARGATAAAPTIPRPTGPNLASQQLLMQQQMLNQGQQQQNDDQSRQVNPQVQGQPLAAVQQPGPATSRKRPSEDPGDPARPPEEHDERAKKARLEALQRTQAANKRAHDFRLQAHCDKADFYRRGKGDEWKAVDRRAIFTARPPGSVPVTEKLLTLQSMQDRRTQTISQMIAKDKKYAVFYRRGEYLAHQYGNRLPAIPTNETARTAINSGAKDLAAAGAKFVRILGQGGFGIAALFELKNETTGAIERIVVKFNSREGGTIEEREKSFLKIFKRSRHIVQLASLKEVHESLGNNNLDAATLQAIKERDSSDQMIILKHCNRGNLNHFLCLSAFKGSQLTNRVLWNFVECLGRGCIAMRAPVRIASNANDLLPEEGPLITESTAPALRGLNLAHLDLDPTNIFMTDDPEAHPELPQLVIADFGLSHCMSLQSRCHDSHSVMLTSRGCKKGFWAPEQFTDQWNEVKSLPFAQFYRKDGSGREHLSPQPGCVAGAIGYWTNVWMCGMVLWSCITRLQPLSPLVPSTCAIGVPPPSVWWHYGYPLLHPTDDGFGDVDPDLKELVCRMLAHEPCNRPTPEAIVETAMKKLEALSDDQSSKLRAEFDNWFRYVQPEPADPIYTNPQEPFPAPVAPPPVPPFPEAQPDPATPAPIVPTAPAPPANP